MEGGGTRIKLYVGGGNAIGCLKHTYLHVVWQLCYCFWRGAPLPRGHKGVVSQVKTKRCRKKLQAAVYELALLLLQQKQPSRNHRPQQERLLAKESNPGKKDEKQISRTVSNGLSTIRNPFPTGARCQTPQAEATIGNMRGCTTNAGGSKSSLSRAVCALRVPSSAQGFKSGKLCNRAADVAGIPRTNTAQWLPREPPTGGTQGRGGKPR